MQPQLFAGTPRRLFDLPERVQLWDVSADGKRFLATKQLGEPPKPTIRAVQNRYKEFRDRQKD